MAVWIENLQMCDQYLTIWMQMVLFCFGFPYLSSSFLNSLYQMHIQIVE